MKIVITESQFDDLKNPPNDKPSKRFDELYGTNLSKEYDLSPYTEDEIWRRWTDYCNVGMFDVS